jgi:hypothetical protein
MPRTWSLLGVTDLHYESPASNFVDDPKDDPDAVFRDAIFGGFYALLDACKPKAFDLVAVGGDITTHGKSNGFARFEKESLPSLTALARDGRGVCVVPGNHDVEWGLDPRHAGAFTKKFAEFVKLVDTAGVTSCLFPEGELAKEAHEPLSFRAPRHGPLYVDEDRRIIALCINSAIRCGEPHPRVHEIQAPLQELQKAIARTRRAEAEPTLERIEQAIRRFAIRDVAQVTKAQQRVLQKQLLDLKEKYGDEWQSFLRVAILHHHLRPFKHQIVEHRGYELLLDAGYVLPLLCDFDFDLVLTGHKHQPYIERHWSDGRELLLVGCPTVGGFSAGDSFRGFRVIDVVEKSDVRTFAIADVWYQDGAGDPKRALDERRGHAFCVPVHQPSTALRQLSARVGYCYREMASITLIDPDGDARRIVECEDLVVKNEASPQASAHAVTLPPTSGYLANLRVFSRGPSIRVERPIPRSQRPQEWSSNLRFDDPLAKNQPVSYRYEWCTVNAFALDEDQFDWMHGRDTAGDNIEFTHLSVDDPVEELAIVVRFPVAYELPRPPRVRVTRAPENGGEWLRDRDAEQALGQAHALRFYESMHIAALRVPAPQPRTRYGIEWNVPAVDHPPDGQRVAIDEFRRGWNAAQYGSDAKSALLAMLAEILGTLRTLFVGDWPGAMDASLIWFDAETDQQRPLTVVAAATEPGPGADGFNECDYRVRFKYGDGIAGRAYKSNRMRVYVAPDPYRDARDEIDYYTPVEGLPTHRVMLAIPLHAPEKIERFEDNPRIYEVKRPYGVLSFGSQQGDCPLINLRVPEHIPALLGFQHQVNDMVFQRLTAIKSSRWR